MDITLIQPYFLNHSLIMCPLRSYMTPIALKLNDFRTTEYDRNKGALDLTEQIYLKINGKEL